MLNRLVVPLGFVIALCALAFVMQSLGDQTPTTTGSVGGPELLKQFEVVEVAAPTATVTDKDNKKIELANALTKPALTTFWSVNCGECETGLPVLADFAKNQSQIEILLVATNSDQSDADEKLRSLNIQLNTYYDLDGTAFTDWEATMPASYFIVDGKIKYFFPGRISKEHLEALLMVR